MLQRPPMEHPEGTNYKYKNVTTARKQKSVKMLALDGHIGRYVLKSIIIIYCVFFLVLFYC